MRSNDAYITNYVDSIKQKAKFLESKGFSIDEVSEYSITYSYDLCSVSIYYGRYNDNPDVYIRFGRVGNNHDQFSIGWLRNIKQVDAGEKDIFIKDGQQIDKLTIIFSLLDYLKDYFNDVTNKDFCRKEMKRVEESFSKGK